jgi:5-(carboxyamino)imidazole ribonucleotide synthase
MLALKGHELGFTIRVLSKDANDPAAQVVQHHQVGDPDQADTLKTFLASVDLATFESEFLDANLLTQVAQSASVQIFPRPQTMAVIQDRLSQKKLLEKHKVPTLPFTQIDTFPVAKMFLSQNKEGIVLKQRRFGYDGYGTFHIRTSAELEKLWSRWQAQSAGLIGEPRSAFRRELAITMVRGRKGQIIEFPLVETRQENSRCVWVKGPVKHRSLIPLRSKLRRLVNAIDYVGVIAFELFETKQGLVVNEIAPRVHNSTHYSLDACTLDQFSAHLLAISGMELKPPRLHSRGFAMMNLLGRSTEPPQWKLDPRTHLHWYGKLDNRPGRKMGHLNAVADSADEALRLVRKAEGLFKL